MGLETARKIANGQGARVSTRARKRKRKARRIYWIGKIDASPDRTFRVPAHHVRWNNRSDKLRRINVWTAAEEQWRLIVHVRMALNE
ncbi:hypothetical protein G5I_00108 [Acromyrmex echinatior]|uniref:Uncharacterized protein n=1 Tax=Acromyrmex echinatior TaxID=103372 RepID=F4W404_ACREC|nr:hypothetical protein G5I_00108 [Acromyrmex echinatior]